MSDFNVGFRLYSSDSGDGIPIYPVSASFGYDKTMNGLATLTFPAGDDALDFMGSTLGSEFAEVGLKVWHADDTAAPLWPGVAIATNLSTANRGQVTITFEHFWQYFQRIRNVLHTGLGTLDLGTVAADVVLQRLQRAQIGPVPTVPAGHPGGRDVFGSFTPAVVADHSPALAPTRRYAEQSGNNLLTLSNSLIEAADLAPVLTDGLDGSFDIDNTYPFENRDLTASVIFGQYHGNLTSFELTSDRAAQANVWAIEGKTASTPQWASDAASITAWGPMEAFGQKPEDSAVSAVLSQTATDLRDGYAETRVEYKAELIGTTGHEFVKDFFWRDRIRIEEAIFGLYIEQTVTGWSMQVERGRLTKTDILLGVPRPPDLMAGVAGYVGRSWPGIGGSQFRNKRQS